MQNCRLQQSQGTLRLLRVIVIQPFQENYVHPLVSYAHISTCQQITFPVCRNAFSQAPISFWHKSLCGIQKQESLISISPRCSDCPCGKTTLGSLVLACAGALALSVSFHCLFIFELPTGKSAVSTADPLNHFQRVSASLTSRRALRKRDQANRAPCDGARGPDVASVLWGHCTHRLC